MKRTILLLIFTVFLFNMGNAQGDIGIVGPAANGWPPDADGNPTDIMLTNNGDGTHTINGLQLSDGQAKFRTDQDWDNDDYGGTFPAENELLVNDFDGNIDVTAGTYDITVDLNNNTYIFELVGTADDTADVQIIHNSADPATQSVDVYLNGNNLIGDDFAFRTATSFLEVPAETPITIDIAPSGSSDFSESIFTFNPTLTADETYVAVANGVLDPMQFDNSVNTIDFGIDVFPGALQASQTAGNVSVIVHHGATDAPAVNVVNNADQSVLVSDISYTEFDVDGYLDLTVQDYVINVEVASDGSNVKSFDVPQQNLSGLAGSAITLVASGFVDPSVNNNGDDFGLFVATPIGGPLLGLPETTVGTDAFTDNNFNYYPNPVEQRLNISSNGIVEYVKIFNMLGEKIKDVEPNTENPQVNMSNLASGAYMMKVSIDGASQSFRVIKN